jgi:hypothetical protein
MSMAFLQRKNVRGLEDLGFHQNKVAKKRLATMVESGNYHSKYQVLSATIS